MWKRKKIFLCLVTLLVVITWLPGAVSATTVKLAAKKPVAVKATVKRPTDIRGSWAEKKINDWVCRGLVPWYNGKTFKPNQAITKGELVSLINEALGLNGNSKVSMTGKPKDKITRGDAAGIISKVFHLDPGRNPSVLTLTKGKGVLDLSQNPKALLTRVEAIAVLDKTVGTLYNEGGIQGPSQGAQYITGNVTINRPAITLRNTVIAGNLHLTEGLGTGTCTLDNVMVKGRTIVSGGSVSIINSNLGAVSINGLDGTHIKLLACGSTMVAAVEVQSSAVLLESNLTGQGFGDVTVSAQPGAQICLDGDFSKLGSVTSGDKIQVQGGKIGALMLAAPDIQAQISNAVVEKAEVTAQGYRAEVDLAENASISNLTVNAAAMITGKGKIESAIINAPGVSIQQSVPRVTVAAGVVAMVGGQEVTATTKPTPDAMMPPGSAIAGGKGSHSHGSGGGYQLSADDLTGLVLSGRPDNFRFVGSTYTYSGVTVVNAISSITVTPIGAGIITVNGSAVVSGAASAPIDLTAGEEMTITVVVNQTARKAKIYTIKITRANPPQNSIISPVVANFDKNVAHQADVLVTLTLNGNTLKAVKNGETTLVADIDYRVDGNVVTIRKEYLANQAVGDLALTFDCSAGADPTLTITIIDTTVHDSEINPVVANFDKNVAHQADVLVTLTLNGNKLKAVKNGESTLVADVDYRVTGNEVTIRKEYLATQAPGTIGLTFDCSAGADPTLTITIIDTTVPRINLLSWSLDMNTGSMTINFDRDVNPSSIRLGRFTLVDGFPVTKRITIDGFANSTGGTVTVILSSQVLNDIKAMRGPGSSADNSYLTMAEDAAQGKNGEALQPIGETSPMKASGYVPDTTGPKISSLSLGNSDGFLQSGDWIVITFSEPMDSMGITTSATAFFTVRVSNADNSEINLIEATSGQLFATITTQFRRYNIGQGDIVFNDCTANWTNDEHRILSITLCNQSGLGNNDHPQSKGTVKARLGIQLRDWAGNPAPDILFTNSSDQRF